MNVTLTISKEYAEPQINIYAPEATEDINKLISYIQNAEKMIAAFLIWFGFSLYYKKEAERLNEQIEKLSLK